MTSSDHASNWAGEEDLQSIHVDLTLSEFVDGECDASGIELSQTYVRERWATYHVIADALREPSSLQPVTASFTARMSAALERELPHGQSPAVPSESPRVVSRWRQAVLAWPGLAVAAAVASVVWVAQPLFGLQETEQAMSVVQSQTQTNQASLVSELTPESDYVSAHRQLAGPIAVRQVGFMPGAD